MTQREFYTEVANCTVLSDDAHKIAQMWLDKDREKNGAKQARDAELREAATALLNGASEPLTASVVADELGTSAPKATTILKSLPGIVVCEVRVGNRIVKGYSL